MIHKITVCNAEVAATSILNGVQGGMNQRETAAARHFRVLARGDVPAYSLPCDVIGSPPGHPPSPVTCLALPFCSAAPQRMYRRRNDIGKLWQVTPVTFLTPGDPKYGDDTPLEAVCLANKVLTASNWMEVLHAPTCGTSARSEARPSGSSPVRAPPHSSYTYPLGNRCDEAYGRGLPRGPRLPIEVTPTTDATRGQGKLLIEANHVPPLRTTVRLNSSRSVAGVEALSASSLDQTAPLEDASGVLHFRSGSEASLASTPDRHFPVLHVP
eukprot:8934683-Pyramimonas_sp.AAC.2